MQATDALKEGIIDGLGGLEDVLKFVAQKKLVAKAQPGMSGRAVYRALKVGMWRETVENLEKDGKGKSSLLDVPGSEQAEAEEIKKRVEQWEGSTKSKL